MKPSSRHLIALLVALLALALPAAAAASPSAVIRDCAEDGSVDGNHSDEDKRAALDQIPADLDEYSDCRSAIAASIDREEDPVAGSSGNGSGGSDDGAQAAASPAARARAAATKRAARRAKAAKRTEALLDDTSIAPATAGAFDQGGTANGLSVPVILALIALTLLLAGGGIYMLGRRRPELLTALRRVPLPFRGR